MRQIINTLKEILKENIIIADGNQHSHAILKEEDESAKLKKLTLKDLTQNMLVITPDKGRKVIDKKNKTIATCMSPLFKATDKFEINRACDGLLLKENDNGHCDIVYIELKSDKPSGYEGQFKNTRCFMRYLKELLKDICQQEMQIASERFVVFHTDKENAHLTLQKRGTRPSPKKANQPDNPDKHPVRDNSEIAIFQIL